MTQHNGKRGFAGVSPERQREIASKGGKMAHARGTAHEYSPEEGREAGRRGGEATRAKYGPEYFAELGRRGGLAKRKKAGGDDAALSR